MYAHFYASRASSVLHRPHKTSRAPIIQNLQEEIDKLLAPLCFQGETASERRAASPSVEAEVIVERAIVETDVEADPSAAGAAGATANGGKRERPPSAASSGGENQAGPPFSLARHYRDGQKVGSRLPELATTARGSPDAWITQPMPRLFY